MSAPTSLQIRYIRRTNKFSSESDLPVTDEFNNEIIDGEFDENGEEIYNYKTLSNGFMVYSSSFMRKCGLMKVDGGIMKKITGLEFDAIEKYVDGIVKAVKDSEWGVINEKGCTIIPFGFDFIEDFTNGKAKAKKEGKWGFINEKGETVIPFEFDSIEGFTNGKAKAKKDGKWSIINEKGEEIFDHRTLSNGLVVYTSFFMEKCALMTNRGERITEFEYDAIEDFVDGMAKSKKDGKCGFINEKGDIVIPFEYSAIEDFVDGMAKAK